MNQPRTIKYQRVFFFCKIIEACPSSAKAIVTRRSDAVVVSVIVLTSKTRSAQESQRRLSLLPTISVVPVDCRHGRWRLKCLNI
jgi:hypothetical protein